MCLHNYLRNKSVPDIHNHQTIIGYYRDQIWVQRRWSEVIFMRNADVHEEDIATVYEVSSNSCGGKKHRRHHVYIKAPCFKFKRMVKLDNNRCCWNALVIAKPSK